jgi:hypothetical protein
MPTAQQGKDPTGAKYNKREQQGFHHSSLTKKICSRCITGNGAGGIKVVAKSILLQNPKPRHENENPGNCIFVAIIA